jgi:hypothetical protein
LAAFAGYKTGDIMNTDTPNAAPGKLVIKRLDAEQAANLLRCLGLALNNMSIFGEQHKAAQTALDEGYTVLTDILAQQPNLTLGSDKTHLICDDHIIVPQTALQRTLLRRWNQLALGSLEFKPGLTREEFAQLIVLLGTASGGAAVQQTLTHGPVLGGFAHLQARRMSYQALTEDDVVVKKQALATVALPTPEKMAKKTDAPKAAVSAEILAYLQGPTSGSLTPSPEAEAIAAQPAKLAELLLRSADIRPETAQVAGGEQLGGLVVGCLRRLHRHLTGTPAAKTKEGKKQVRQTLIMMEKEVIERLRGMAGTDAATAAEGEISAAVSELVGDVRLDALVGDFAKKRKQTETTEQRLLRYIAARQDDEDRAEDLEKLRQKLAESGLTPADWIELQHKSALLTLAKGDAGETPPLPLLLMRLTELLNPATPIPEAAQQQEQVAPLVNQIQSGVTQDIAGVEQKVEKLREQVKELEPLPETSAPQDVQKQALSRRKIIAILAEIVQELRQPLAVISGAVEALSGGHFGQVAEAQRGMLQLALQSSQRLGTIVDALAQIAGQPATLQPDAEIIKRLYEP